MKALSVGAPLRGVAAYLTTIVVGLVVLNVFIAAYGVWQFGSWSFAGVAMLSVLATIFAAPLSVLVLFAALPIQMSRAPRPLADILVWGGASVLLVLVWWSDAIAGITDHSREPADALTIVLVFVFGGVGGFVYWLLAGRPAPPYDR